MHNFVLNVKHYYIWSLADFNSVCFEFYILYTD